jgi:hypothetical protein
MNELLKQLGEYKNQEITDEVVSLADQKALDMKEKANEVMHTTNTGYGKELIPVDVLTDTVLDLIPTYSGILNAFMVGFHGNQMGASEKLPIVGEIPFAQGNAEWTTGAGAISQGLYKLPTADVTITQQDLIISVDISKKEMAYAVVDLQAMILTKIAQSFTRTIESIIVNADSNTSSVGNINSVDQAPATTFAATGGASDHRLLGFTGLRATALAGTSGTDYVDVGALTMGDFFDVRANMGGYSTALNDLVLISDFKTYNKALTLSEFLEFQKNGKASTAITGALANIAGVDMFIHRDYPATNTAGKVSVTASNNTKGSFLYAFRPCVQWGYGKDGMDVTVVKVPGKGYQAIATMNFGVTVVNKKAGVTDPAIVLGYNVS